MQFETWPVGSQVIEPVMSMVRLPKAVVELRQLGKAVTFIITVSSSTSPPLMK